MAIETNATPDTEMNRTCRLAASLGSLAVGALGAAGLVVLLLLRPDQPGEEAALQMLWVALGVLVAVAGYLLLRGRSAALWLLLAYWLLVTLGAVLQGFYWLLHETVPMLPGFLAPAAGVYVPAKILIGGTLAGLLAATTRPATRHRYAAVVGVSVAATLAVVVVANLIALWAPVEKDVETFGRFGLSERTRRILADVQTPVTLSAVYPGATGEAADPDAQARTRKQLDRVMEFLDEVHRANPTVEVVNASSDAARSRLITSLRQRQQAATAEQEQLLNEVLQVCPQILDALQASRQRWAEAPREGFLAQWQLQAGLEERLRSWADELRNRRDEVLQEQQTNPLPDYVKLLKQMTATLTELRDSAKTLREQLRKLGAMPQTVAENAPGFRDALAQAVSASQAALQKLQSPAPDTTVAQQLEAFAESAGQASKALREALRVFETLAGSDEQTVRLLMLARAWLVPRQTPQGTVSVHVPSQLVSLAREMETLRAETATMVNDANAEAQQRYLGQLAKPVGQIVQDVQTVAETLRKGLASLQDVDDFSQQLFEQAKNDELFAPILKDLQPLLDQAGKLQAPDEQPLPEGLNEDNILVLQTPDRVEVVGYDEVWPLKMDTGSPFVTGGDQPRYFNADAALGSRLLKLTQPGPFARVLLTYYRPPANNPRMRPVEGDIPVSQLQTIRQQLEEANFRVRNWNLAEPMPEPLPAGDAQSRPAELPTVLLVLPPASSPVPPGMGGPEQRFGPEELQRLRSAIDGGASALFLTSYLMPMPLGYGQLVPQNYPLNSYLRQDWGLEARTNHFIVSGQPTSEPGVYNMQLLRFRWFPLSGFSGHPIGEPLRGQWMFWQLMCPLDYDPAALPAGVSVSTLLRIPETATNVWASSDLQKISEDIQLRGNRVSPNYEAGDLKAPLTVALAATRSPAGQDRPATRLVLLGLGQGLVDPYLQGPVIRPEGEVVKTYDPPRANPDLVVNSAYWLIGKERFIASGPVRIEPVAEMSRTTRTTLWVVCVLAVPLAVLTAGGVVMILRSRS